MHRMLNQGFTKLATIKEELYNIAVFSHQDRHNEFPYDPVEIPIYYNAKDKSVQIAIETAYYNENTKAIETKIPIHKLTFSKAAPTSFF